jgi:hypothetical protein
LRRLRHRRGGANAEISLRLIQDRQKRDLRS